MTTAHSTNRTVALRKLLALGEMDRIDIERCTHWPDEDVADALAELRSMGELVTSQSKSLKQRHSLTAQARQRAFAGA